MIGAYESYWFPVIRPAIRPLFLRGTLGQGWLTSRDQFFFSEASGKFNMEPQNEGLAFLNAGFLSKRLDV